MDNLVDYNHKVFLPAGIMLTYIMQVIALGVQ